MLGGGHQRENFMWIQSHVTFNFIFNFNLILQKKMQKSKNIFFIIWQKKLKKNIFLPCRLSFYDNVSEKQLKLTHE